jgi:hypothetical protein
MFSNVTDINRLSSPLAQVNSFVVVAVAVAVDVAEADADPEVAIAPSI